MTQSFWLGLAIILLSGILNATFPLPMKYARKWKWENTWLVFTTLALLVFPVGLARMAVPSLWAVYGSLPPGDFAPGLTFGFLWGLAQVTFGLSIAMVGMAMAFAIVVGMSGLLGSLFPMIVLHPGDLLGRPGLILMSSAAILIVGLVIYARAGRQREADSGLASGADNYRKGLALCLFTGAMGGMINLGFAFSVRLAERAAAFGASPQNANLAVWVVVLGAGYVPNLVYTSYLLSKNGTARTFRLSAGRETILAVLMAGFWLSGTLGYGAGATAMGSYGTSIGYVLYVTALLLWSTTLGVLAGEWKSASATTLRRMKISVAVILLSVAVLSSTGLFT